MMRGLIWIGLLMAVTAVTGCVNTPQGAAADATVAIEVVHAGSVCSGAPRLPKATWIDSHQDLSRHWQRLLSHRLGDGKPLIPQVEWDTHGLVLIHMGQKTTGGHRLELAQPHGRVHAGSVLVRINWVEPPAGAITAQMITSPCLLLKFQRGEYQSVVILDQSNHQRAKSHLPK